MESQWPSPDRGQPRSSSAEVVNEAMVVKQRRSMNGGKVLMVDQLAVVNWMNVLPLSEVEVIERVSSPQTEEWLEADARLADSTSTAWDVRATSPAQSCFLVLPERGEAAAVTFE